MAGKHNKCCCSGLCEGVTHLYDTGEEVSGAPCATSVGIDDHWTADGGDAYAIVAGTVPEDPTHIDLCPDLRGITEVCAADLADKAIVEPGGADGAETVMETYFTIGAGVDLDRIAICGQFTADNYVKAGKWLVNDIDQDQIYHGAYDDGFGITACVPFGITKETADLVVGNNTVAITIKNGYYTDGDYGGPLYLKVTWLCVERFACSGFSAPWIAVDDGFGGLEWQRYGEDECPCYCADGGEPVATPSYEDELAYVTCEEFPE